MPPSFRELCSARSALTRSEAEYGTANDPESHPDARFIQLTAKFVL